MPFCQCVREVRDFKLNLAFPYMTHEQRHYWHTNRFSLVRMLWEAAAEIPQSTTKIAVNCEHSFKNVDIFTTSPVLPLIPIPPNRSRLTVSQVFTYVTAGKTLLITRHRSVAVAATSSQTGRHRMDTESFRTVHVENSCQLLWCTSKPCMKVLFYVSLAFKFTNTENRTVWGFERYITDQQIIVGWFH